ncbi:KEOPS complex subunit Cgi121 [Haloglomus litoreum]|uniref:KEOPS complex subunit Cgi121 n=1 Tax=Haloglomus litoreum TaxID=3034026 RepID=UPI0023E82A96|nr:KEOPS complex subunit Cgi121 [Haloglomus sp. DT116]
MRLVEGIVHVAGGNDRAAEASAPETAPVFDDVDALVARLDEVASEHGVTVQAFDAGLVTGREHLERALELADRERARGEGIARDRAVEVLLYAAGRRQIDRALELGVGPGATPAVVLLDAEGEDGDEAAAADAVRALLEPAETLGDYDPARVRAFFDIEDAELAATDADLPALVHERVALLVVNR